MNNLQLIRKSIGQFIYSTHKRVRLLQPCILCGQSSLTMCCTACEAELPQVHGVRGVEICEQCALPISAAHCINCAQHRMAFDATFAKFDFDYPVDHLVHTLKYQGQLAVAAWLAQQLLPLAQQIQQRHAISLFQPMPLHPKRLAERGFNQSHEIAKLIAKKMGLPCQQNLVTRRYHLRPQVELGYQARRQQPDDLFEAHADLQGTHIVLIDDVMTTGTSLHNLAAALKKYGAQRVTCLVVARAHEKQRSQQP